MIKEIFEFSEENIKTNVLREVELSEKIKFCFNHLFKNKRLPINVLDKDNWFDFSKLESKKGKNYDWFFLTNDKVTILIRQYGTHFTLFTKLNKKGIDSFFTKSSVFTLNFNREKINDDRLSDKFCDNPFLGLGELLPDLIKHIEDGKTHSLWNDYSFKRPKYVEVKIAYNGGDDVSKLDLLLFACDELFGKFLESYAENEILDKVKTFNVGDRFGEDNVIVEVRTEVKDDYYHSVGLEYKDKGGEEKWEDVYALARWYYDDLFYDGLEDKIKVFVYGNYQAIFDFVSENKVFGFVFATNFIKESWKRFNEINEIDYSRFQELIPKGFEEFIEQLYYIKHFNKKV